MAVTSRRYRHRPCAQVARVDCQYSFTIRDAFQVPQFHQTFSNFYSELLEGLGGHRRLQAASVDDVEKLKASLRERTSFKHLLKTSVCDGCKPDSAYLSLCKCRAKRAGSFLRSITRSGAASFRKHGNVLAGRMKRLRSKERRLSFT